MDNAYSWLVSKQQGKIVTEASYRAFEQRLFLSSINSAGRRKSNILFRLFHHPPRLAERNSFSKIPFQKDFSPINSPDRGKKLFRIPVNQLGPGFLDFY